MDAQKQPTPGRLIELEYSPEPEKIEEWAEQAYRETEKHCVQLESLRRSDW